MPDTKTPRWDGAWWDAPKEMANPYQTLSQEMVDALVAELELVKAERDEALSILEATVAALQPTGPTGTTQEDRPA